MLNKFKTFVLSSFLLLFCLTNTQAQLISYNLQQSFTTVQLDSFITSTGFSFPIGPLYDIDVYQIIYETPYLHPDSMVKASGIAVYPKGTSCPSALACYNYGTFSKIVESPSYDASEKPISYLFAGIGGVTTVMPDGLGLGDSDSSILIHPYINYFHNSYSSVNLMRAARQLADILSHDLSGEVVLTGYSKGGYITAATNKLIQLNYPNEFDIKASAPMSGPYDLGKTMVDVMLSNDTFPVPSYLPFLILGYHSVYPSLQQIYPTPSHIFKSPYDTIIPPMFYSKTFSTTDINAFCSPIPRDMLLDSVVDHFTNDLNHPLRQILEENELLYNWVPQNPVKIQYCNADEEVSYLNAVRADSVWNANGAPNVTSEDFGSLSHFNCVEPALTSTVFFLLNNISECGVSSQYDLKNHLIEVFPNPSFGLFNIRNTEGFKNLNVYDINGKNVYKSFINNEFVQVNLQHLSKGFYIIELVDNNQNNFRKRIIIK